MEPLIPAIAEDATHVVYERKEIVNAIFYVLRSGFPWRLMPHDLPNWSTVYDYFRQWRQDGTWEKVLLSLRREVRQREGREPEPNAAVIDSLGLPDYFGVYKLGRSRIRRSNSTGLTYWRVEWR